MEEIQVGEYVRTDKGKIVKIDGNWKYSTNNAGTILFVNISKIPVNYYTEKILKHSFNLIDLIEVGDYVNGRKVINTGKYNSEYPAFMVGKTYVELEADEIWICTQERIKSIVTHEQFSSLEYKVEEK